LIFVQILKNIFVVPLELVYEAIFQTAYYITRKEGIAILILSIVVSTLVLPLYMRAEKIEEEQREKEKSLSKWSSHIKKHFRGDEKFMELSAYYRENHYTPASQLKSSLSLLLQIPFFLAAYDLLAVRAISRFWGTGGGIFGFELASPDRLLNFAGFNFNALPILMTLVNVLTTYLFTKGYSFKESMRSYILSFVFLILLYNSPSVLLVYWTMNNFYSLFKTIIIKKIKSSKSKDSSDKESQTPADSRKTPEKKHRTFIKGAPDTVLFILTAVYLAVLTGLMIPLSYLSASPSEFVVISNPQNPLIYLTSSFFVAIGFFVFWPGVFYYLANKTIRKVISVVMIGGAVFATVNSLILGKHAGVINTTLIFDSRTSYSSAQKIGNLVLVCAIVIACVFLYRFKKSMKYIFIAAIMSLVSVSVINAQKVQKSYNDVISQISTLREVSSPKITLSPDDKNVMVIMLDKAVSPYIPYIFHEFPELEKQYDGFVYYPNTTSFGSYTIHTTSALFGGYEYTPERLDARSDELLSEKHDESLKVLPKLFSEKGYTSTLMELPFAGWSWQGNYDAFSDIENCHPYYPKDYYNSDTEMHVNLDTRRNRNLFMYSLFKCTPLCFQDYIYDGGDYLTVALESTNSYNVVQNYKVLENLDDMTVISNDCNGGLFLIDNQTTHDVHTMIDYDPYNLCEFENSSFIYNGNRLVELWNHYQSSTYQCLVAAMRELGKYMDYLKEIGVYDNTRIIIVSDHGTDVKVFDNLAFEKLDVERLNCLLMVKDFDAKGFKTDYTFMTNADVPCIAMEGIIEDPINPYTGKAINMDPKYKGLYIIYSSEDGKLEWNPEYNQGTGFNYSENDTWYKLLNRDIFNEDNWVPVEEPQYEPIP